MQCQVTSHRPARMCLKHSAPLKKKSHQSMLELTTKLCVQHTRPVYHLIVSGHEFACSLLRPSHCLLVEPSLNPLMARTCSEWAGRMAKRTRSLICLTLICIGSLFEPQICVLMKGLLTSRPLVRFMPCRIKMYLVRVARPNGLLAILSWQVTYNNKFAL